MNKVLGHLPDLGDELASCRQHATGKDAEKVYPAGAQVNIASGLCYSMVRETFGLQNPSPILTMALLDVLGIGDEDYWG